ncbi:MAG TPA: sigma-70 region 4 domain-containing protein [Steroidobacteraceae bacterium]|jgi:DNA-directed RNA polymerase specialized sigma24 family protein
MTVKDSPAHDPEMARLTKCAQSLPTDVRRAFTLRKVYELSYPEIATHLNLTIAEIEDLLVQAVLTLDKTLDAKDCLSSNP